MKAAWVLMVRSSAISRCHSSGIFAPEILSHRPGSKSSGDMCDTPRPCTAYEDEVGLGSVSSNGQMRTGLRVGGGQLGDGLPPTEVSAQPRRTLRLANASKTWSSRSRRRQVLTVCHAL